MRREAIIAFVLAFTMTAAVPAAVPPLMNYQGRLTDAGGGPVPDADYSVVFTIYDAAEGGAVQWTETQAVATANGLFSVLLGAVVALAPDVFVDSARYLGIAVAGESEMAPRTRLTASPYAMQAASLPGVDIGPSNVNTGLYSVVFGDSNTVTGDYSVVAGGRGNTASGEIVDTGGALGLDAGFLPTGVGATVGGGVENEASGRYSTVSGGWRDTASNFLATVGGGYRNNASGGHSTVGGGAFNNASGGVSAVGGGWSNNASGGGSTVGGGVGNNASGVNSTVGGGGNNNASVVYSTVSGGFNNDANGNYSSIGGGRRNIVGGDYSVVPGGFADTITATADYSYLFGIGSHLSADSTFMVDMPHIRFGDEATGYEIPPIDGVAGDVMTTDGTGQVSWSAPAGGGSGWTDDGTVVRLDGIDDSVGIGTTAPTEKLDVEGNIHASGTLISGNSITIDGAADRITASTGTISFDDENLTTTGTATVGGFVMNVSPTAGYVFTTDGSGSATWQAAPGGSGNGWSDDGTVVRLDGIDDSVGIGTTAPTEKLDVAGNIHASGTLISGNSITIDGATDRITASTGTISFDDENLTTTGTATVGGFVMNVSPTAGYVLTTDGSGSATWQAAPGGGAGGWTDAGTVVRLTGIDDSVGIGTTAPTEKLEVDGNLRVSGKGSFGPGVVNSGANAFAAGNVNIASGIGSSVTGGLFNTALGDYTHVGGGSSNDADSMYAAIGGGRWNSAVGDFSFVGGGRSNSAAGAFSFVGGGDGNNASGNRGTIVGGSGNVASGLRATVVAGISDSAIGDWSFVGGGSLNTADGNHAAIAGGAGNFAGLNAFVGGGRWDSASANNSVIAGGEINVALGAGSAVMGGRGNRASGNYASICGGLLNTTGADHAIALGGTDNHALAKHSVATGRGAYAAHVGAFVFNSNSTSHDTISSVASYQFVVRALGGIWLGTTTAPTATAGRFIETSTGAYLSDGGAWTNSSDESLKENFAPIDSDELLNKIRSLEITEWNYKCEQDDIRHIGPTAQEFERVFGLGGDGKAISTIDPAGIALAAIQSLCEKSQRVDALEHTNRELSIRLDRLEQMIQELSQK